MLDYLLSRDDAERETLRAEMVAYDAALVDLIQRMDEADTDREDIETLAGIERWLAEHHVWVPPDGASVESVIEKMKPEAAQRPAAQAKNRHHGAGSVARLARSFAEGSVHVLHFHNLVEPFLVLGRFLPNAFQMGRVFYHFA